MVSKYRLFGTAKLQNHTDEGKGQEKMKEQGGRKEEKRKRQLYHS